MRNTLWWNTIIRHLNMLAFLFSENTKLFWLYHVWNSESDVLYRYLKCVHMTKYSLYFDQSNIHTFERTTPPPPPPKKWIFNCFSCISNVIRERNDFPVKLNISVFLFFFFSYKLRFDWCFKCTGRFGLHSCH